MANLGYLQLTRNCYQKCQFCSNPPTGVHLDEEEMRRNIDHLIEIAEQRGTTLSAVLDDIDAHRKNSNLSSHIRMFVLDYYRSRGLPPAG